MTTQCRGHGDWMRLGASDSQQRERPARKPTLRWRNAGASRQPFLGKSEAAIYIYVQYKYMRV